MSCKTWRHSWIEPLAGLLRRVTIFRRRAAKRSRVVLLLEELESRLAPSATAQFTAGAETVNEAAGTFSIPVTLMGAPPPTVTTFASGFSVPAGLAFDTAGNLYVANAGNNTVSEVSPSGTVSTFVSTGLNQPESLAFDTSGNLYIANTGDDTVSKVVNRNVSTFASGFGAAPSGLAFDQSGNLYVAIGAHDTISKVTPQGSISDFVAPGPGAPDGLGDPSGLAFDSAGNLYVANFGGFGGNTISEVTPAGTVSTFVADDAGLNGPEGLAFDAAGNLYVSNFAGTTVSEVTPAGTVSTFASGFNEPLGLAFAPSSGDGQDGDVSITGPVQGGVTGNLFVSNFSASTDTVSELPQLGQAG